MARFGNHLPGRHAHAGGASFRAALRPVLPLARHLRTDCRRLSVPGNDLARPAGLLSRILASQTPDDREIRLLEGVPRLAAFYLAIAAVVPMLAVLLIILSSAESHLATSLLIVASLAGFLAAWYTSTRFAATSPPSASPRGRATALEWGRRRTLECRNSNDRMTNGEVVSREIETTLAGEAPMS